MQGIHVIEFLTELESRFEDFKLTHNDLEWLKRIEKESQERSISFPEVVSILTSLAGPSKPTNSISKRLEGVYIERIKELEGDLDKRRQESEALEQQVAELEVDLSRANHRVVEVWGYHTI